MTGSSAGCFGRQGSGGATERRGPRSSPAKAVRRAPAGLRLSDPRTGSPFAGSSICDVLDGVAEIAVVMARKDKVWAMAVRMELARGRWLCTHLEVV